MNKNKNTFMELVKNKLQRRTTEQLKNYVIESRNSNEHGTNVIFVAALTILESRLTPEEYEKFEDNLGRLPNVYDVDVPDLTL